MHPHHDRVRVILGGCREHNLLRTASQMRFHLLGRQEHAGGLTHIVGAIGSERDLCRIAGMGQSNLVAVDHKRIAISLNGAIVLAATAVKTRAHAAELTNPEEPAASKRTLPNCFATSTCCAPRRPGVGTTNVCELPKK